MARKTRAAARRADAGLSSPPPPVDAPMWLQQGAHPADRPGFQPGGSRHG
jgi:hypothetical protein